MEMIDFKCEKEMCERMKGKLRICENCLRVVEIIDKKDDKITEIKMKKYGKMMEFCGTCGIPISCERCGENHLIIVLCWKCFNEFWQNIAPEQKVKK